MPLRPWHHLRRLLLEAADLIYPACCLCCDAALHDPAARVCGTCLATVVPVHHRACRRCGAEPVAHTTDHPDRCRRCTRRDFAFRRAVAAVRYGGAMREAVLKLKYHGAREAVPFLGDHLVAAIRDTGLHLRVSRITYIPLHPWRRMRRGFDQAELLACHAANHLGLPLIRGAIRRSRATHPQSRSLPTERAANLKDAFRPGLFRRRVRGRAVLVVDDVMSTGSTAHEAARALVQAGARVVYVAVVAT